jgi:N-acetylglucosaminyldiphosphoundecaprenol N-acetyl-beta-D-mannosaminyltransferase
MTHPGRSIPTDDQIALKKRFSYNRVLNVLGVAVDPVSLDSAADMICRWAETRADRAKYVCVSGMHGVMEAQDDEQMRTILNRADLNVPDGMPLVFLGRYSGFNSMTRVFGPDLMHEVMRRSASKGLSHFFYGGQEGVAAELAQRMQHLYPGLRVAGTYCPPFRSLSGPEAKKILNMINETSPDFVWVGLSTPKQEQWMAEFRDGLTARVLLGVGAAFDYNTGRLQRAPRWMQNLGLEWLYRLMQEPRRLYKRYLMNIPRFLLRIASQALGIREYTIP